MVTESNAASAGLTAYRLVGEVAGESRSYPLEEGGNSVGSAGADVVLPVRGVSRDHALLDLRDDTVALTDRGSKNGSFVNGRPVEHAALEVGDEVRFGPVRLRLETAHPDDTYLAFSLTPLPEGSLSSAFGGETSFLPADRMGGSDLALLQGLLGFLEVRPEADLPGALAWLVKALEARAAALVDAPPGSTPSVIAAAGTLGALPELPPPTPTSETVRGTDTTVRREGELLCAVNRRPGGTVGGLLLWRDPPPPTADSVLELLLRLLFLFHQPSPAEEAPRQQLTDLDLPPGIVAGSSPAMASLYQRMALVRNASRPVLILGETGVGKEHVARTLHRSSRRHRSPFVAVNCSALPSELLEAEMFGVERGTATGVRQRHGKFMEANGGTLFLDEIGEMPLPLQGKLLRALQEGVIEPLGGSPTRVDVRVISATNRDPDTLVERGGFRRDLYFRLAGFVLE
ncbi:MAG: sigma 54-interacting transcriptional regulator, partial [Acidobacteria bacterium]|nr:sigma 54-interacting transcriptional regulator [Acidobacteriota bacterium]